MLLPTQSAWQESSASRRLSGDPIPIAREVSEGRAETQYLLAGISLPSDFTKERAHR